MKYAKYFIYYQNLEFIRKIRIVCERKSVCVCMCLCVIKNQTA